MTHRVHLEFSRTGAFAALAAWVLTAGCAQTTGESISFRSVLIGDRGISVPLPPPSLLDAPKQSVDIEVVLSGDAELSTGTELRIVDNEGELEFTLALEDADPVVAQGVALDLTMNCLEVWLVDDDREGDHALYSASIAADDQSVDTTPGCP